MGNNATVDIFYGFYSDGGGCDTLIPADENTYEPHYDIYDFGDDGYPAEYKRRTGNEVAESGCMMEQWGAIAYGDAGQFVAIKSTHIKGDWESGLGLDPQHFSQDTGSYDEKLRAFCEVMDIKWQQPKWWALCSES